MACSPLLSDSLDAPRLPKTSPGLPAVCSADTSPFLSPACRWHHKKHGNQTWLGEPADLNQVASFFHGWLVVLSKTPLKNDGLKVSWEYDSQYIYIYTYIYTYIEK